MSENTETRTEAVEEVADFLAADQCKYCRDLQTFTKAEPYDDEPTEWMHFVVGQERKDGNQLACEASHFHYHMQRFRDGYEPGQF